MTPADLRFLAAFLKERSGLVLAADRQYLAESRLAQLARRFGLGGAGDIVPALRKGADKTLADAVVETMTNGESLFFRDRIPFGLFQDAMLPALMARRGRRRHLRIWCAGVSTGQEPYSLSMAAREMGPRLAGWRLSILGTDINASAIEKAKAGIYSQYEVQRGLPVRLMLKYFERTGDVWQIAPALRSMVDHRVFNLLDDFVPLGTFDIVFCRNVLRDLDRSVRRSVLERLAGAMAPDGYLVLGAAETAVGLCDAFETVPGTRGLYRLRGAGAGIILRPFAPLREAAAHPPAGGFPAGAGPRPAVLAAAARQ